MGRKTNYQKRLEAQNPNDAHKLSAKLNCKDVHDYVDWNTLNGEVVTRKLTKEELEAYLNGELRF